ncbi:tetratricopeptide repeat protein [Actinosynnema sp. NPDC050436]|uniref:tetratricopeptide repeat protein n=1 Tax=Actinosynnema sp. NPDC050436 TaxID=3155659 RepID=UPI0034024BEE
MAQARAQFAASARHRRLLVLSLHDLGNALRRQGRLTEALAAHEEALEISRTWHGKGIKDVHVVDSLVNLARDLRPAGRLQEARTRGHEALTLARTFPPLRFGHHDRLLTTLHELGLTLREIGDHHEALELAEEALTIARRPGQPDSSRRRSHLARAVRDLQALRSPTSP